MRVNHEGFPACFLCPPQNRSQDQSRRLGIQLVLFQKNLEKNSLLKDRTKTVFLYLSIKPEVGKGERPNEEKKLFEFGNGN